MAVEYRVKIWASKKGEQTKLTLLYNPPIIPRLNENWVVNNTPYKVTEVIHKVVNKSDVKNYELDIEIYCYHDPGISIR